MAQAHSAIPFPSSPSRNMHASPLLSSPCRDSSLNQVEFAHLFGSPTPTQTPSSPQQKSHGQHQTPERPSQPHTPLTPPLTPASTNETSIGESNGTGMSAFSTPARGPAAPPPTPASVALLSSSGFSTSHMGPPSPVAVGNTGGRWTVSSDSRRTRPLPHRIECETLGGAGTGGALSPHSERSERSPELGDLIRASERVPASAKDNTNGERYLLVGNVPNNASGDELREAFHPCGDVKGICLLFQEAEGLVILAFYDCRITAHAERYICAPGQTYFGGRRLRAEKMGAAELRNLMGDSEFINETEGEVLVTTDGQIDPSSLKSIIAGFGELRAFDQLNVPGDPAYIAEFFDCRKAKNAMGALNERSIFGIRLCLVPKHAAPADFLNRVPFPQYSDLKQNRHGGSQPTSPLNTNGSLARLRADQFVSSSFHHEKSLENNEKDVNADTSNSSPFHGSRALPLISPLSHAHSLTLHGNGGRRISTGSVGLPGGSGLHQSTSEQDLRRRAAANSSACVNAEDGWMGDHARRTSDTFCFNALKRVVGDLNSSDGQGGHVGIGPLGRRTRAISDSSASPRVVSPSEGFSTAGMDVGLPGHSSFNEPATPEHNSVAGTSAYYRDDRERDSDPEHSANAHSRFPTSSESSLGGPHTPSPGPVTYNIPSYYTSSPSVLGIPGMIAPAHHSAGQYYLTSALGTATSPAAMRYGYPPHSAGYSPGGLSIPSSASSPSSLHSPHSSIMYSPSHGGHHGQLHTAHLPSSARSALDVTRDPPAERNQVDLDRISAGIDTRTTVMIKNIPNKLSDRDLVDYIGRVCPRKIDFLYLRMDFQNGCNVGYAFVNFINVQDLLQFARTKLGVKWNMFSSEKVLQMSYANYQGKEALVEKFKNSCVMDEREAWRPKIFHSSGPNQGLPEPFPAPTHFRRKERSAQNRGALFMSGPNAHSHGTGTGERGRNGGSGMLGVPLRRPHQHPQNLARQDRF